MTTIENATIYPTHTCFDDSLEIMQALLKHAPTDRERLRLARVLRLVHAECVLPSTEKRFAHAWLEELKGPVFFMGILNGERCVFQADRDAYYDRLQVVSLIRYAYPQVIEWNRQTGHFGPWTEYLRQLCRRPS